MAAAALLWIATAWPSGALALAFAAIVVILFPTRGDQANPIAMSFMLGTCVTAVLAGIVLFCDIAKRGDFPCFQHCDRCCACAGRRPSVVARTNVHGRDGKLHSYPRARQSNELRYPAIQQLGAGHRRRNGGRVLALHLLPQLSPATRVRRLLALISRGPAAPRDRARFHRRRTGPARSAVVYLHCRRKPTRCKPRGSRLLFRPGPRLSGFAASFPDLAGVPSRPSS